ncbi:cytochrome c oxidase assembly protein [Sutcliffiella halmapala]
MNMDEHHHHVNGDSINQISEMVPQLILAFPFVVILILYGVGVLLSNRHYKRWPIYRTVLFFIGAMLAILTVLGPVADRAHNDFTAHMLGHLLLGMLAPLLMALATPMTLLLRTISVRGARGLTGILKSRFGLILSDPVTATLLNVGGLWVLYTTDLYELMHQNMFLHIVIHLHVFLAGYLFTISIIYIDPAPHRRSFIYRSIILLTALAAHGILSKFIYANPPVGVPKDQAESGAMLMYYGGDAVDLILIVFLCLHWYNATRPRETFAMAGK